MPLVRIEGGQVGFPSQAVLGAGQVQGHVPAAVPGDAGGNVDEVAAQHGRRRQVASASRSELEPPPPGISPSAIR